MNIRKILGLRPRVGDEISAGLDFGVWFTGTITEDHSRCKFFPRYIASGTVHIQNPLGNIEKQEDCAIIPAGKATIK